MKVLHGGRVLRGGLPGDHLDPVPAGLPELSSLRQHLRRRDHAGDDGQLVPGLGWLLPIPFYFLELLVGLVQALVFMLLTAVFTLLICQHTRKKATRPRTTERRASAPRNRVGSGRRSDGKERSKTRMTGNLHVGLAASGRGHRRGPHRHEGIRGGGTQSRRVHEDPGAVDSGHRLRGSDRLLRAVPRAVDGASSATVRPSRVRP